MRKVNWIVAARLGLYGVLLLGIGLFWAWIISLIF
jgi:hypothetical protein